MMVVSDEQIAAAKDDFRVFLWILWRYLGLPDPTPIQYEIAHYLQHGPQRTVVMAFRGIGKSWITSAFSVWTLWRNPQRKVLATSASKDRSDAFTNFSKKLIDLVPFLNHLRPNVSAGQRNSSVQFDVGPALPAHAPSVKSSGIYGQITGARATDAIGDDVEVPNNTETSTQREKLEARVAEIGGAILTPGGADIAAGARSIYLGTCQCEETLYWKLVDKGYSMRIWPARVPESAEPYRGCLAPSIVKMIEDGVPPGTPTDTRFSAEELDAREREYGRAAFRLQFMLDTSLTDAERYPLKTRDFITMPTDRDVFPQKVIWAGDGDHTIEELPRVGLMGDSFQRPMHVSDDYVPYQHSIMYIDPSGRGKDEVGYAILKALHGYIVVRDWDGLVGGYDEDTLAKLAELAYGERVRRIVVEDTFGDGMWLQLFRPVLRRVWAHLSGVAESEADRMDESADARRWAKPPSLEDDKPGQTQKEVRLIESLEPPLSSHRIILDEALAKRLTRSRIHDLDANARLKSGFYQLTRLTRERGALRWDDRIDALAGGVRQFQSGLSVDADEAVKRRKKAALEKELRKFMERAGSKLPKNDTWGRVAAR